MDSLGDRMKSYEQASRSVLPGRLPVIIRVDGKAFHTYTRGCKRPFDERLSITMVHVAKRLCEEIQGAQLAYTQSDEISVLVHGYKRFESQSWFDSQVQKMVSVAASIAAAEFTARSYFIFAHDDPDAIRCIKPAYFDARAFVIPEGDVCNYFLWRQQDATRNSVQMLARSLYSHKQLDGKSTVELKEMCVAAGKDWDQLPLRWQRGVCLRKHTFTTASGGWAPGDAEPVSRTAWRTDEEIPLFNQDRDYVNCLLKTEE